jgi:hypothetical protein
MSKRYKVESYDAYDIPDPHWIKAGEFDTPGEALACAHSIVRWSLERLYAKNRPDAERLFLLYHCAGEVPSIFGEPKVPFDPYLAAKWYARAITERSAAAA